MAPFAQAQIAVVGGGVTGLCTALALVRAGAQVAVYSRDRFDTTASGVAAGMLAPAIEAALELGNAPGYQVLSSGRDLWPDLLSSLDGDGVRLNTAGALWAALPGEEALLDDVAARLAQVGGAAARLDGSQAHEALPELSPEVIGGVYTPDDWTLDPRAVLRGLLNALEHEGAKIERANVAADPQGQLHIDGAPLHADRVVLAVGADVAGFTSAAPELACISPIKGQLLALDGPPICGVTLRTGSAYVAPQATGALIGATMEPGLHDHRPDPTKLARLQSDAARFLPHLEHMTGQARVGLRAATPDGWPLVGPSARAGVWLAAGMRRNGWVLAPWVGARLAQQMQDRSMSRWAGAVDPCRFQSTGAQ